MPRNSPAATPANDHRSASRPAKGREGLLPQLLALLIFLLSFATTYGLWRSAHVEAMKELRADFDFRVLETAERIEQRMGTYEQVLRGTKGFLGGSTDVSHERFRAYVETLRLERHYPGIQGIALSQIVLPADKDRHVAAIRELGFSDYAIRPAGEREIYSSISHIEPLTGLNPSALGFDMFSEPIRQAAMARARDTGNAALSGKLKLIQERAERSQAGFVMYVPLYRAGMPADTIEQRRANIIGWVGGPFRMDDLMANLGGQRLADLRLQIYDGNAMTEAAKLFESGSRSADPLFSQTRRLLIAGRPWVLSIESTPAFEARIDTEKPRFIALTGAGISLLLGTLVWVLATGRRRALALATAMTNELRASESRWKYALEGAGDGVWDWNIRTGQVLYTRQWKKMLGYADDDIAPEASEWDRLTHPADKQRVTSILAAHLEGRSPSYASEHRLLCKDGSWKWVLSRGMVVSRDRDGNALRMIGTHSDITARKQAEEREAERLQQLEEARTALHHAQKLEAVGKLTGGVAHDFNNALQIIGGNLQLLELRTGGNEQAAALIHGAMKAVDRGAKLSSQLLAFARRQPLQPRVVNLGRMTRSMDELMRRALGESIEIHTIIAPVMLNTLVDPYQLENVILNLALNSRDAMQGQGSLTIEAGSEYLDAGTDSDTDTVPGPELPPGRYVTLAISDTGSGMTPEVLEHAFEPFFTTKPEGQGTGLGLSMAYGFVKQSGGHIRIFSEVGHGTMVKIYLPASDDPETDMSVVTSQTVIGGSETILVVEDDAGVRGVVVGMLTELGYRVLQAQDGREALDALASGESIDLLFTDVVMPGPVQSPELAARAKQMVPGIAVLFTSGYTRDVITQDGRLDADLQLLSKPYRREQLAIRIRSMLFHRQGQRPMETPTARPIPISALTPPVEEDAAGDPLLPATRRREILVVEDNNDMRMLLCEMLGILGHHPHPAANAEDALQRLSHGGIDVLLTDIGLPGMSGVELAEAAAAADASMKIIFASGHGETVQTPHNLSSVTLAKPYTLIQLQQALQSV
ncbi:MAG TPA: CHASE domain-containing protein [Noviherbaspirillum sp.]|jgi:PAS domain S-box-containing protein|uniref:CHASE domain-containing protein n=1 Tax=Noviherbaspirillum sp. TaxID=1926288 RepID=UPI002DDCF112|nr:CHASE domain-containing protein [Noviherbaspirillum sp.]HEV2609031.1 CHASE domain-containing protein [Noviherbaspirillum sp.]